MNLPQIISMSSAERLIDQEQESRHLKLAFLYRDRKKIRRYPSRNSDPANIHHGEWFRRLPPQDDIEEALDSFEKDIFGSYERGEARDTLVRRVALLGVYYVVVPIMIQNYLAGLLLSPFVIYAEEEAELSDIADLILAHFRADSSEREGLMEFLEEQRLSTEELGQFCNAVEAAAKELKTIVRAGYGNALQLEIARHCKAFASVASGELQENFLESKPFSLRSVFQTAIGRARETGGFCFLAIVECSALVGRKPAVSGADLPDNEAEAYRLFSDLKQSLLEPIFRGENKVEEFCRDDAGEVKWGAVGRLFSEGSDEESARSSRLLTRRFVTVGRKEFLIIAGDSESIFANRSRFLASNSRAFFAELASTVERFLSAFEALRRLQDTIPDTIHSIRIPMQLVMNQTEIAQMEIEAGGGAGEAVSACLRNIVQATLLQKAQTKGYMLFSSGSDHTAQKLFKMQRVAIAGLIERMVQLFSSPDLSQNVELQLARLPWNAFERETYLDAGYFDVLLLNLLDNAVKYSFPGREVRIALDSVQIHGVANWKLSISNFGQPISADEDHAIYEPYYRALVIRDPRNFKAGTGIGLAVAQRIAKVHGGEITHTCHSETFQGRGGQIGQLDGHEGVGFNVTFNFTWPKDARALDASRG